MATTTTNYKLSKPAGSDKYDVSVHNANMDAIDTQMKANADAIMDASNTYETKANAITGLSVSGKTITYTKGNGATGTINTQDTNTDTKVTQSNSSANAEYPILIKNGTGTDEVTTITLFDDGVTVNPSTGTVTANAFKGTLDGNAKTATSATKATTADSATKATQDGNGKVIATTYATKGEVNAKVSQSDYDTKVASLETSIASKATSSDLTALSKTVDGKANSSDVYTKTQIDTTISGINTTLGKKANAENVYSKTEVDTKLAGKSDSGHVHDAYATKTELSDGLAGKANKSHAHDDMYYTETEVNNLLSGKADKAHTHSDYVTTTTYNSGLSGKADKTHVHDDYATVSALQTLQNTVDSLDIPDGVMVDSELKSDSTNPVENKVVTSALGSKANSSDVYNKTEIDSKVSTINTALSTKAVASNVYSKTEVDGLLDTKQDALTADAGLAFDGTTIKHSNSVTAQTTKIGSTTSVPRFSYDAQGHITGTSTATIYPPTTVGTAGQLWVSKGSGVGKWGPTITISTSDPSGGSDGDIWYKYE